MTGWVDGKVTVLVVVLIRRPLVVIPMLRWIVEDALWSYNCGADFFRFDDDIDSGREESYWARDVFLPNIGCGNMVYQTLTRQRYYWNFVPSIEWLKDLYTDQFTTFADLSSHPDMLVHPLHTLSSHPPSSDLSAYLGRSPHHLLEKETCSTTVGFRCERRS